MPTTYTDGRPLRLAVLISGNGSNLQAIIDAIDDGLPAEICVVLSNKADAYGLKRAEQADISTEVLSPKDFADRDAYDQALITRLQEYRPNLIILAGFMWILGPAFVQAFKHRILNIHPSLLPKYPGTNTHERVLAAGEKTHGATVHLVTEVLDEGPIIAQESVSVSPDDTAHSLQHKVHALEHNIYPEVIKLCAAGRLEFSDNGVFLDGEPLNSHGLALRVHY
jgi:phosphoribosylglycinamide formyltransferase-1